MSSNDARHQDRLHLGAGGVAAAGSGSGSGVGGGAVQGGSTGVGAGPGGGKQVPVWQGALRWNGIGQTGKKEVGCNVVVMSMSPHEWCVFFGNSYLICACALTVRCDDSHAETWPQSLQLVPTEADMPMQDLQPWLKRVQPTLCMFQLQNASSAEPKGNEQYYRALVGMLTSRKQVCIYHFF